MYCSSMPLHWSVDRKTWTLLTPTQVVYDGPIYLETHPGYISEDDWKHIGVLMGESFTVSTAEMLLIRTHELLDKGQI
jgi:hypothetical protein